MDTTTPPLPLAARSPIPDLCPPATVTIVTGASHSGKRQFLLGLLPDLLGTRPILDPARRPYASTRLDRPPRVGWLTLTHGDPQVSQQLLEQELARHALAMVLADRAHFCHRALSTGQLTSAPDTAHACPLHRTVLLEAFSGAFSTRPGGHSTLALPELLILDDLHTLLLDASPNSFYHVSRLMDSLATVLTQCGTTLIALAPATKLKSGERYHKIPDRVLGSGGGWGRAHGVWLVETDGEDERAGNDDSRAVTLTIAVQGLPVEQHWLEREQSGLLRPSALGVMAAAEWGAALDAWLGLQRAGTAVSTSDIEQAAAKAGASRDQAQRWLRRQREDGRLEASGKRGLYTVRALV